MNLSRLIVAFATVLCACLLTVGCWREPVAKNPLAGWVYPEPIASWDEATKEAQRKSARKLVAEVKAAVERGDKEFTVAPGDYRFGSPDLKNFPITAKDFTINAFGATFWFNGRIPVDAMAIDGSTRLTIRGLTVDYDPFPFTQGEVVKIDPEAKCFEVKLDPGFPLLDDWKMGGNVKAPFFTPEGRLRQTRMDWVKSAEHIGDGLYRVALINNFVFTYKNDQPQVGDRLVFPDRSMRMAFKLQNSEAVTLEDITVYSCPHMAFSEGNGEGGHVYRRCKVILRPGTKRLIACNADVFHTIKARKGPLIEECEFSHACDDLINIHGFFSSVLEVRSPREMIVVPFYGDDVAPGVRLSFNARGSMRPLGEAVVLKATPLTDQKTIAAAKAIPEELGKLGDKVNIFISGRVYPCLVELDAPVEAKQYDYVSSSDRIARGTVIRNNYFHDTFARAVLVKSEDFVIENNRIERTGSSAMLVASDVFFWEGPFARRGLIKGNTITDCGLSLLSRLWNNGFHGTIAVWTGGTNHAFAKEGVHNAQIDIIDNRIIAPAVVGIFMANTRNSRIEGNRIEKPCALPLPTEATKELRDASYAIYLASDEDIICRNNVVTGAGPDCKGAVGVKEVRNIDCDVKYDTVK